MKIMNLSSATVIIESDGKKILMDPWLVDGEYYGSWFHYPKLEINLEIINSCDFIYVSHIHPDHFSRKSFALLDKNIPVLIHDYESKFLKFNIEKLGFNVIELPNNKAFPLGEHLHIKIIAADNCNPELCSKFFGCSFIENRFQSTQIDSMALVYDDQHSILNTNDCPFELAQHALDAILQETPKIDLALIGYAGAGPYPQCFVMEEEQKITAAKDKELSFLNQGLSYIDYIKPTYFMPFAGTYVLGGKLRELNKYRGVAEIHQALLYLNEKNNSSAQGFLLNQYQSFDLKTGEPGAAYVAEDSTCKWAYIESALADCKLDFEEDEFPSEEAILSLVPAAFERFKLKKAEIKLNSATQLILSLGYSKNIVIDLAGHCEYTLVDDSALHAISTFVRISVDTRLLYRILKGPRFAHWNNAEIGSHLGFERKPDVFERGIYHALSYFHS